MTVASRLHAAIRAANIPIVSVSIGTAGNKATWKVDPSNLQSAAQPIIDAFQVAEPPAISALIPGGYLGVFDADPDGLKDGDLWIVRGAFPTQRRVVKFRDGDVTRTLQTLVL